METREEHSPSPTDLRPSDVSMKDVVESDGAPPRKRVRTPCTPESRQQRSEVASSSSSSSSSADAPPSKLGPWIVGPKVGQGSFATIYDVYRPGDQTDKWVAKVTRVPTEKKTKVSPAERHASGLMIEYCMYQALSRGGPSAHVPSLPPPSSCCFGSNFKGFRYLVMEKIEGKTLTQLRGELDDDEIASRLEAIGRAVLLAIKGVHARGIIHSDIKPDNIFIRDGDAVIVDFGISGRTDATRVRGEIGTMPFMARRLHGKGAPPSRFEDLESLAYTLLWMVRGSLPWSHVMSSPEMLRMKNKLVMSKEVPPCIREYCNDVLNVKDYAARPDYARLLSYFPASDTKQ